MTRDDAGLPGERGLRARRPSTVFDVYDESGERTSHGIQLPSGNREWVQVDQTVHGRHYVDFGLRFFYFAFACLLYSLWECAEVLSDDTGS